MGSTYKSASKSHVGMVRQVNEDACLDLPENRLWVVADGMGGHAAGDYVSSLIVDSLRSVPMGRSLDEYSAALRNDLIRINAAVREETANRGVTMMGSTVVVLGAVVLNCQRASTVGGQAAVPSFGRLIVRLCGRAS